METIEKGDISQVMVTAALLRSGATVLEPIGANHRYDLVIERDGVFYRVQCKTGRLRRGAVLFNACSSGGVKSHRRHYRGQIDMFGVFCHETDTCYLVPVNDVPITEGCLRVDSPVQKQPNVLRWAKDYIIHRA